MNIHPSIPTGVAELLLKVKEKIISEPKQFRMRDLFYSNDDSGTNREEIPNCGTAACLLGLGASIFLHENPQDARKTIDTNGGVHNLREEFPFFRLSVDQQYSLFHTIFWPKRFKMEASDFDALPPEKRASLACERIDHFLTTGE